MDRSDRNNKGLTHAQPARGPHSRQPHAEHNERGNMSDNTIEPEDSTIERIRKMVNDLSETHTVREPSGKFTLLIEREPLIEQIRRAMYGDLGRTEAGKSAAAQERSVLDVTAFTIYEDITGRIEAYHHMLTKKPKRESPEATLRSWYVAFRSNHDAGKYSEEALQRTLKQLRQFAGRIKGHFDQPRNKEIEGACPLEQCGVATHTGPQGAKQTALYAIYSEGKQPSVKCRNCGAEWTGEQTLLELGRYLGANVDEETLREMGVIV